MAMTPYSGDTSVIGKLGTTPQERGLTTQQFKDKFDEGLKEFVTWFNSTHKTEFDALLAETTEHSGFAGKTIFAGEISDFNTFNTPGAYECVVANTAIANEPYTGTAPRRFIVYVRNGYTEGVVMQEIWYLEGPYATRRFYRTKTGAYGPWCELNIADKGVILESDLDNIKAPGVYNFISTPEGHLWNLIVTNSKYTSESVTQMAIRTYSSLEVKVRSYYSAIGWTPWHTLMTTNKDQTMAAKLKAQNNTDYTTAQVRNIILSPDEANAELMGEGDIWIKYE